MQFDDIDAVVEIETEAFSSPWQKETFAGLIGRDGVELVVMTDGTAGVIGYAVLWCVLDQGELANVALTPERRGVGLGAHLLRYLLSVATGRGVKKLFLEVRASNERALDLYHRFGFDDVGLRRGYYDNPKEDARVMLMTLGDCADP
jgi:ribosomal-protein-alanine N-acetyltransferase